MRIEPIVEPGGDVSIVLPIERPKTRRDQNLREYSWPSKKCTFLAIFLCAAGVFSIYQVKRCITAWGLIKFLQDCRYPEHYPLMITI